MEAEVPVMVCEDRFLAENRFWLIAYAADLCTRSCPYCYNRKPRMGQLLDFGKLEELVLRIKEATGKNVWLELIGGEPMLHPGVLELCSRMKDVCADVQVLTNLDADASKLKQVLATGARLFASWHSGGQTGFLQKAAELGGSQVSYCVMMENGSAWDESEAVFLKLLEMHPKSVELSLIGGDDEPYVYTQQQLARHKQLANMVDSSFNMYNVKYADGSSKLRSFSDLYLNPSISFKGWLCRARADHMYVHADGKVYACQSDYDFKLPAMCSLHTEGWQNHLSFKPTVCKHDACSCTYCIKKERLLRCLARH